MGRSSSFLMCVFCTVLLIAILTCDAKPQGGEKDCPQICPANYAPVCGANGTEKKTFPNRCAFTAQSCNSPGWKLLDEKSEC